MKQFGLWLGLLVVFVLVTPVHAQMQDVKITASRKKLDETKSREGGNITVTTKEYSYEVTVQNTTFRPIPEITVKYMVFLTDSKSGSTEGAMQKAHTGKETLKDVASRAKVSFGTKPIKLSTEDLDAGWYYATGAENRARDKTNGIWIRAYVDGNMVGEYANPSTIAKKNDWKE